MRVGGLVGVGADRCEHSGENAARWYGQSAAGTPQKLECVEEGLDGSWDVDSHVGKSDDEEATQQNQAQLELDTCATASIVDLQRR